MSNNTHKYNDNWNRFDRDDRLWQGLFVTTAAIIFIFSWIQLNVRYDFILSSPAEFYDLFSRMWPPNVEYISSIVNPMIITIHIAILGTLIALIISGPVAFIGARNTTPNRFTYALGKFIIAGSRSVNTIIWALIFVVIFGAGPTAGVFAIGLRSVGMCSKLLAEEIEEIDFGQTEAIRAAGGSSMDVIIYGIVPQILPTFVGISTYRWDINVRGSTILGFVGAGGIGVEFITAVNAFQWHTVTTILIAILLVVLFSEAVSAWARAKVR